MVFKTYVSYTTGAQGSRLDSDVILQFWSEYFFASYFATLLMNLNSVA
jgi:hypothetical protein